MLADQVDFVVGVDTHKETHTAAALTSLGATRLVTTVPATTSGYRRLLEWAHEHAPGRRCWAVESTGAYGSGLTSCLLDAGEWVVELDRPARQASRNGKSDPLDAIRAGREALSRERLARPRCRGDREAMRVLLVTRHSAIHAYVQAVNHLKFLLVSAPDHLRSELRSCARKQLLARCASLRRREGDAELRATLRVLRLTARRALALKAEADELEAELRTLVAAQAPELLNEPGVGAVTAAQILTSWSHPGRLRSEAAFAALAGAAPIPASSGQVTRHRLNRGGDRQLNRALHIVLLSRLAYHDETKAYAARRRAEGKSDREIRRCLKRFLARRLFRLVEAGGPGRVSLARQTLDSDVAA